jgi:hypothetical protein
LHGGTTYTLADPKLWVEKDVITTLNTIAKIDWLHHFILGQPQLEFLVVTPASVVPIENNQLMNRLGDEDDLQLLSSDHLLDVLRVIIEHEHQSLIAEVGQLGFNRLNVKNLVAVWQGVLWNVWPSWRVIPW